MADFPPPQSVPGNPTAPVTAGLLAYALMAIAAVVEIAPLRPNPVTQDEMDAGSIELF